MSDETYDETCPHCGKRLKDLYEYFPKGDDTVEVECGWCEKPLEITLTTDVSYRIEKREA